MLQEHHCNSLQDYKEDECRYQSLRSTEYCPVKLDKLFCSAKFYHFGADISRPKNYQEIALKPEASLTIFRGRSKTIYRPEWFLNSVEFAFWKVPRCACHNMVDKRNCWGPNKLWDETRSWFLATFLKIIQQMQLCLSLSKLWSTLLHWNKIQPRNVQASVDHLETI